MTIFRRPDYQSEATQFIDQLKAARPLLESQQRQGRGLLWDQTLDRSTQKDIRAGQIDQKPYVYQTNSD